MCEGLPGHVFLPFHYGDRDGGGEPRAANELTLEQMRTIQSYVKSAGKGLVVVGGDKSYGLGDYLGTPLEETIPVSVRPPSAEQKSTVAHNKSQRKSSAGVATFTSIQSSGTVKYGPRRSWPTI